MNILVGLLPAILWGINPLLATIFGGKAINQLVGAAFGQFMVGIIVYIIVKPSISFYDFLWPFLGGLAWSVAQLFQYMSFKKMNVSTVMPISTGLQLIEIPLVGVIFWGDWGSSQAKLLGFFSIGLLIIGTCFTSFKDNTFERPKMDYKTGLTLLIIGSFGYTACSVFSNITHVSGVTGLLPQTMGMAVGGLVLGTTNQFKNKEKIILTKATFKSLSMGITGGLGMLAYLTSLNLNGVANAFPLTQMNVVVSTIGGILILKERKDKKELTFTLLGLAIIIMAAVIIGGLSK